MSDLVDGADRALLDVHALIPPEREGLEARPPEQAPLHGMHADPWPGGVEEELAPQLRLLRHRLERLQRR